MRGCHPRCDRGEVDIIGPSEGLVASSILAGRTSLAPVLAAGFCGVAGHVARKLRWLTASPAATSLTSCSRRRSCYHFLTRLRCGARAASPSQPRVAGVRFVRNADPRFKPRHLRDGKTHKACIWAYCTTSANPTKAVVPELSETRAGETVREFLGLDTRPRPGRARW